MNIYTFRVPKKKILIATAIAVAILILLILLLPGRSAASAASTVSGIKTGDDQIQYLQSLGYTVDPSSMQSRKVTIPASFDDVYLTYNTMQQDCGFDLLDYTGKKVQLVTYSVTNYPGEEAVLVDLLIYKNTLIGGAFYTTAIDGFMHGLRPLNS